MIDYFKILRFYVNSDLIVKRLFLKRLVSKIGLGNLLFKYEFKKYKSTVQASFERLIDLEKISKIYLESCDVKTLKYLCEMYMAHRYSILGSGWVSADINASPLGLEGFKYYADSNRPFEKTLRNKVDENYSLIDWQRDVKTGYLFDVEKPSFEIMKNLPQGVDLKMPWELSRMYHLPQLALAIVALKEKRELFLNEFKNQVIDFCESNPIGYGVNWSCTMDVAIRAVNLLVAYDIFEQQDTNGIIDDSFKRYFLENIIRHGRFIAFNLEKDIVNNVSGNHYLSNLCGLIFIASYVKNKETKRWFEFAAKEFLSEFDKQFLDDGGNYECSTAYHRLSAEIAVYTIALLIRAGFHIEDKILKKLNSIAFFSEMTIKPDGTIIQIGDNDSGRLLKLSLAGTFVSVNEYESRYFDAKGYSKMYNDKYVFVENELKVDSVISAIYAITKHDYIKEYYEKSPLEGNIIYSILSNREISCNTSYNYSFDDYSLQDLDNIMTCLCYGMETNIELLGSINISNVKLKAAPDFGLIVFMNDGFKLFIRSPADLTIMSHAHLHNDFLHFEISIGENNYFSDQGSYIYTPLINKRNEFRSIRAHNVPYHYREPNEFRGCFSSIIKTKGTITELTSNSIGMYISFDDIVHFRRIILGNSEITVIDKSNKPFSYDCKEFKYISSGYGKLAERKMENEGIRITRKIY